MLRLTNIVVLSHSSCQRAKRIRLALGGNTRLRCTLPWYVRPSLQNYSYALCTALLETTGVGYIVFAIGIGGLHMRSKIIHHVLLFLLCGGLNFARTELSAVTSVDGWPGFDSRQRQEFLSSSLPDVLRVRTLIILCCWHFLFKLKYGRPAVLLTGPDALSPAALSAVESGQSVQLTTHVSPMPILSTATSVY